MRAVIVVADAAQRHLLATTMATQPGVDVVAEFARASDALLQLSSAPADVIFFDVTDSDLDPVEFARRLSQYPWIPQLVLLADNDHHALLSFETHAADYLIRPVNRARMARTLIRVEERLGRRMPDHSTIMRIDEQRNREARSDQRIAFRSKGKVTFLRSDEIRFITAEGNYLKVHARPQVQRFRDTISNVEQKLDPRTFMRIHRSTIINLHHLREVRSLQSGDAVVVLTDGTPLAISRTYRDAIHRYFSAGMVG